MAIHTLSVPFNNQQRELLERMIRDDSEIRSLADLVTYALVTSNVADHIVDTPHRPQKEAVALRVIREYSVEPGKGFAIEVKAGEVLRIQQVAGGQCMDFNCFNLNNRNEALHTGRTRSLHGNHPTAGDMLWSKAPWERPMAAILESTAENDTLFPCCSSMLYGYFFGQHRHTNCTQIQAEAQREYQLQPHHVHESFNLFMYTDVELDGRPTILRNRSVAGDFIDIYPLMDILAVTNICGDDFGPTSNYSLKPTKAYVLESKPEQHAAAMRILSTVDKLKPYFADVKSYNEEPLLRDSNYQGAFPYHPITISETTVSLDDQDHEKLLSVVDSSLYEGDLGMVLRDVTMTWVGKQLRW